MEPPWKRSGPGAPGKGRERGQCEAGPPPHPPAPLPVESRGAAASLDLRITSVALAEADEAAAGVDGGPFLHESSASRISPRGETCPRWPPASPHRTGDGRESQVPRRGARRRWGRSVETASPPCVHRSIWSTTRRTNGSGCTSVMQTLVNELNKSVPRFVWIDCDPANKCVFFSPLNRCKQVRHQAPVYNP